MFIWSYNVCLSDSIMAVWTSFFLHQKAAYNSKSDLGRHSISCNSLLRLTPAACQDQLWPLACFSGEMKPGQLTHQLKQVVSKPGHVNKMCHWFVNLKVNCCYKTTLSVYCFLYLIPWWQYIHILFIWSNNGNILFYLIL